MANTSILAAFERMWTHIVYKLSEKADVEHTHTEYAESHHTHDEYADSDHVHNYAASNSAGGSANSAAKLDANAGSGTQPVYFSNGVPVNTTYTLGKSVPSNAVFTDTKNTAGSSNSSSKLFLIGATSQAANPQTYSHDTAYVGTDGCLYSNNTKVSVEGHTHTPPTLSATHDDNGNVTLSIGG